MYQFRCVNYVLLVLCVGPFAVAPLPSLAAPDTCTSPNTFVNCTGDQSEGITGAQIDSDTGYISDLLVFDLTQHITPATGNSGVDIDYGDRLNTSSGTLDFMGGDYSIFTSGQDIVRLSAVPAVPIPAAVWLFDSSMLGLVTIGRRRRVA